MNRASRSAEYKQFEPSHIWLKVDKTTNTYCFEPVWIFLGLRKKWETDARAEDCDGFQTQQAPTARAGLVLAKFYVSMYRD